MYKLGKRIFDFVFALTLLILLIPLFLIIALAIKIDSSGPIFYFQERLGKNKKPFRIYKFRSMLKAARKIEEKKYKPGIPKEKLYTRVGKFLRKVHLDEFPQLINVITGKMSFVGPRPPMAKTEDHLPSWQEEVKEIYKLKPGITGLGRILELWPEKKETLLSHLKNTEKLQKETIRLPFELYYIQNCSFIVDFWILWYTFRLFLKKLLHAIF